MPNDFTPDRIREIREFTGLDRTNFAAAIGVSRVSVWRYEEGVSHPENTLICEQLERYEAVMLRASQEHETE